MNILFITADQWRADCLSVLGHPVVRTPNLDRLAREAVTFTAHYCQAAPCGPSRASMHTGLYPMTHRSITNGTPLDRRHRNWAQLMRAGGWDPVLFGYTDTSVDPRDYPAGHPALTTYEGILPGLDCRLHVNLGDTSNWSRWLTNHGYQIPTPAERLYRMKAKGLEWEDGGETPLPLAVAADHHDTRFVTNAAIDYLRTNPSRPWCVHLSLLRPHPPWIAPEPYNALYPPDALPRFVRAATPEQESLQHPWLAAAIEARATRVPESEAKLRRLQASYYGLMTEVDDNLGRLFDALRESGQWDDTLIVFTSDHGEQMGDHWLMGKAGYFDQSFHVPLIVRDPTAPARHGSRVGAFTEHVDLMPTLLTYAGIEVPPQCDGVPLRPLLQSAKPPPRWREAVHWEYDFRDEPPRGHEVVSALPMHARVMSVLRDARYKYVHFVGLPALLIDLTEGSESIDRASDPSCASTTLGYAQRMLDLRLRHADHAMTHLHLGPNGVTTRTELP